MPPEKKKKNRALFLDARKMEPPEPFIRAVEILAALNPGDYLHFLHTHTPFMLFPELEALGMIEETVQNHSGLIHVFVWRENDSAAQQAARHDIAAILKGDNHK